MCRLLKMLKKLTMHLIFKKYKALRNKLLDTFEKIKIK